jgi:hypothetical protein
MLLGVYVHLHHEKGMKGDKPSYIQFTVTRVTLNPRVILILPPPPRHTLQLKSDIFTPRKETARPQSQVPHSCVCERFTVYIPMIGPPYFPAEE